MTSRNLITIPVLALAFSAAADSMKAEEPKPAAAAGLTRGDTQTAVFLLRYAVAGEVGRLLEPAAGIYGGKLQYSHSPDSQTIMALGSKEWLAACADLIKQVDVPSKPAPNFEFTFYILVASQKPIADGGCPSPITIFCEQMKGMFKGFRLLETVVLRAREGRSAKTKGIIPSAEPGGDSMPYTLKIEAPYVVDEDAGKKSLIRINKLAFNVDVPFKKEGQFGSNAVGMESNIDLREGQDAALSTFSQGKAGESLCIVVRAKVLD